MELCDIIKSRRSCRCFLDIPVEKEKLETILNAGILAPTVHNLQPFRFFVPFGEKKDEMIHEIVSELNEEKKMGLPFCHAIRSVRIMKNAPVNIYIIMEQNDFVNYDDIKANMDDKINDYIKMQNFAQNVISAGTTIENMLLTAKDVGIGSICISEVCYAVNFSMNYFCGLNGKKYQLVSSLVLGYEDKDLIGQKTKRKPYDEMVIYAE